MPHSSASHQSSAVLEEVTSKIGVGTSTRRTDSDEISPIAITKTTFPAVCRSAWADWNALLNLSPPFANQPIIEKQKCNRTFGSLTMRFEERFALWGREVPAEPQIAA
jgi:hypothetical protein